MLAAQMSIPYCVSIALRDGSVGVAQFSAAARSDRSVKRVADAVRVVVTDEFNRAYPERQPARVNIRLADGTALSGMIERPWGAPENPMRDADIEHKFHGLCDSVLGRPRAEALVSSVWAGGFRRGLAALRAGREGSVH
jgi:2-methylcitrate dehydratase